ncbi:ammonium transporter [Acidipropionibacterium acidipropionici]|uniref:Ammonium transporter n=2 Tax=Acidipropionibacterium acidipropionici TaxID=1748 RepID=A0AAC8YEJ2_9ACTN|nr:ammonium transporter [Acidipropionibacterium acidipropionici]AMS05301.1 ammonia channel protein [Acidipropionibacterium acidipropionici]AZP37146.1 ammonium transporter [Acidipropionibacterium acidipropionici]
MTPLLEISAGDTAWVLASAVLVLWMTPAVAFFYGGMVRAKGVLNMLMMSMIPTATIAILWILFGFSMVFGDSKGFIGNPAQYAGMHGVIGGEQGTIPLFVFAAFQSAFAIIAVALVAGAAADRMKFSSWVVFSALWGVLCYFPAANWVFGTGWILNTMHAVDFAGGTAIHINAGAGALALALVLGKRVGFGSKPMRPHNTTMVMLGAAGLWFGWFGFNAGSALGANELAGIAWINTLIGAGAALLGWIIVEKIRDGHPTTLGAASGMVAGLVGITPACAAVSPLGAIIVGGLAGIICAMAVGLKYRFGYDDSLDVVGVHMVGGLVGTVVIGLVADPTYMAIGHPAALEANGSGLFYGGGIKLLGVQALCAVAVMIYSFVVSFIIAWVLKKTMGIRLSTKDELTGIDLIEHAEAGYDLSNVRYTSYRIRDSLVLPASPKSPTGPSATAADSDKTGANA